MNEAATTQRSAPAPSPAEIERKLSVRSTVRRDTSRRAKPQVTSGTESDSSIASSSFLPIVASPGSGFSSHFPTSPILSASTTNAGGLSAIAEQGRKDSGYGIDDPLDDEQFEVQNVDEAEAEGEASEEEENVNGESDLERGMEGERVFKSGFLIKKQERRKIWKKKWFVLRATKLAYYKDNREYSLSRAIDLHQVHSVVPVQAEKQKHPFAFAIVTSDRTFFVEALSVQERDNWVRAINNVQQRMSEREVEARRPEKAEGRAITMPIRPNDNELETHPGTWTSTLSAGSVSSSPVVTSGYFHPRVPSQTTAHQTQISAFSGHPNLPPSPLDTTNSLTSQIATISLAQSLPQAAEVPSAASVNRRLSNPIMPSMTISTSRTTHQGARNDPSPTTDQAPHAVAALSPVASAAQLASSDEDEAYYSDPQVVWPESHTPSASHTNAVTADPHKVILATYLMKKSRKAARGVWRKRWFLLTSSGITYTKNHMDARSMTFIPIPSILDIFALDKDDADEDEVPATDILHGVPARLPSTRRKYDDGGAPRAAERVIRIVTAKRRYDLCVPSEEEEIKWIAAIRALVNRERERIIPGSSSTASAAALNPRAEIVTKSPTMMPLPTIIQQPPTPASISPTSPTEGVDVSGATRGRDRSGTQTARSAVADVVRRFHESAQ